MKPLVFSSLIVLVYGCAFVPAPAARLHVRDQISGSWALTLESDSAEDQHSLIGDIVLLSAPPHDRVPWMSLPSPTHIGVHNINLESFGIHYQQNGPVPFAGAMVLRKDSVEIVLNPGPDHGAVVMRGTVQNTVIRGTWKINSYGVGRSGGFSMRRR